MEGKEAKELRKGALKCVSLKERKTAAVKGNNTPTCITGKSQRQKQENQKMHILKSQNSCAGQLETLTERTLVYSWICVSLLRNVHSQLDHNDITLLSPATRSFDFLLRFIVCPWQAESVWEAGSGKK